ncbi:hypothetical protein Z043-124141 [Arapaima gigas]
MSEAIAAFQSQLSGLMETVFKAAVYEIVRLVEDSFVEEVSRTREQVEALRKRLQWAEGRRRGREVTRCAQCGMAAAGVSHTGGAQGSGLKQEGGSEGRWSSCIRENMEPPAVRGPEQEAVPTAVVAPEVGVVSETHRAASVLSGCCPECHCVTCVLCSPGTEEPGSVCLRRRDFREVLDTQCSPPVVTDQWVGTSLLYTPPPPIPRHTVKRLSPEGAPRCTSMTQTTGGQQRTALALGGCSPQVKPRPVAEHLSTSRSPHCKLQSDLGDPLFIKQEEEGHLAEWDGAARSEDAVVQEKRCGERQATVNIRSGTELDMSSSEHVSRALSACLKRAEPQLQVGGQKHASPGTPVSVTLTVSGGKDPPTEGPGGVYRKCAVTGKSGEGHTGVCIPDRRLGCVHVGKAGRTPHSCGQCGKSFSHSCHLKAHQQIHTGERPFVCTLCGRSFTKLSNLKAHRRVHTGERPYVCTACGKCFTQKCNLKRHQRIHAAHTLLACT